MRYEVCEKKFYPLDLNSLVNIEGNLIHLETTFDLEKYSLEILVSYIDNEDKINNEMFVLPIELESSMTDTVTAKLANLKHHVREKEGIELEFTIVVDVLPIVDEKTEIKENYQQELEDKFRETEEVAILEDEVVEEVIADDLNNVRIDSFTSENNNILNGLKTDYVKYKIINLDEDSLDKISVKYNLSINYLYELKKHSNKVMVYDKE